MKKRKGSEDVILAFQHLSLPIFLAYSDIRQRYRRSSLGPFWITISTGVMIACIGLIFGRLFKAPMSEFLPFLSSGLIIWGFISTVLTEATQSFVSSEQIIKQLPLPLFTHILRMVTRNIIIFAHNLVILPIVYFCVGKSIGTEFFLFIPGMFLLLLNLLWMSLLLGIVCTRFRDLVQIVGSVLQIFFYVTPIIWVPNLLPQRTSMMILDPNPVYHMIQLVRAPLIGELPSMLDWGYCLVLMLIGSFFTIKLFNTYKGKIAYWL